MGEAGGKGEKGGSISSIYLDKYILLWPQSFIYLEHHYNLAAVHLTYLPMAMPESEDVHRASVLIRRSRVWPDTKAS